MNLVGQRIGSYVVERELGAGGTGTVYLCQHTLIERQVAVKVLHDDQARDPDQVARFFQEAKAAAEIGHPNIIVIIDYGSIDSPDGKRPYLMMECLDGESLDKRLRKGGLSLADITHILSQVCSALVACHGKGIIHRDLKPSNVFLCHRSFDPLFVKVLDFGTAKLTAPGASTHKTMMGMVLGTPAYMSPEQCEGKGAIDHRSDIYSLGVMLYEMLTGTLPFEGELGEVLLHHMFHQPQAPRERNPAIPPEWEALCLRMIEKGREDRFQSVTELAHALEDLRGHADAYAAFRAARASHGTSGRTMVATAEQLGLRPDAIVVDPSASSDRATVMAMVTPHGLTSPVAGASAVAPQPTPPGGVPAAAPPPHPTPPATPAAPTPAAPAPAVPTPAAPAPAPHVTPAAFAAPPISTGPHVSGAYAAVPHPTPSGMHAPAHPTPSGMHAQPHLPPSGLHGTASLPHVSGAYPAAPHTTPPGPYAAPVAPAVETAPPQAPTPAPVDPVHACTALVTEARYVGFARTLMVRPGGRWYDVFEVCRTGGVAAPAVLPVRDALYVTWVEHPYPDPSLAAVIFLSLRTGWSQVVLCARARW